MRRLKGWFWRRKGWVLIISVAISIVVAIILAVVHKEWVPASPIPLALNLLNAITIAKGVYKTMKIGLRQAELDQQEKDERVHRLLDLDERQRIDGIQLSLKTIVDHVRYNIINNTAPNMVVTVRFFNLLVRRIDFTGYKLYMDQTDKGQVKCQGNPLQLYPQEITPDKNCKHIEATTDKTIDLAINLPDTVAKIIERNATDRQHVRYDLRIEWQLDIEGLGAQTFKDDLSHMEIPNLRA